MIKHILTFLLLIQTLSAVFAQKSDAKDYIISGNQRYMEGDFSKSEAQYKIALSEDSNSIKANYNLGNALYKQKRMNEARVHYDRVIQNSQASKSDKHKAYHNIGKSYLDENNAEKAVANLKEALKLNPYDDQTRYNYALARKLLEKQSEEKEKNQNGEDQGDSKKNQEDNKENPEKQDKGDKGENGEDSKPQNQNGNQEGGQNGDEKGDGETPQNQKITKGDDGKGKSSSQPMNTERQEGLLEALRQQEQETLKRIISQKAQKVRVNTEKDW